MKINLIRSLFLIILVVSTSFYISCKKEKKQQVPILTTTEVTNNNSSSGGNITNEGSSPITSRGIYWGKNSTPTIYDSITLSGSGTGIFTSAIRNLSPGTNYYVRAFATNSAGTGYGEALSFATAATYPVVTTNAVSNILATNATCGGIVTSDGGSTITARGICWSTSINPIVSLPTKTIDGIVIGVYTSNLTGLQHATTYYVRAYATNSVGTSYGNQITFVTNHEIGESYRGGIIIYILQPTDPGFINGETHGLIAAPTDQSPVSEWGCYGTAINGADGTAIGTGLQNTIDIIAGCSTTGTAARLCRGVLINGYSDWYLPSYDEMSKIIQHQSVIGGLPGDIYWTSSEFDSGNVRILWANGNNSYGYGGKGGPHYVRPVKSF